MLEMLPVTIQAVKKLENKTKRKQKNNNLTLFCLTSYNLFSHSVTLNLNILLLFKPK